MSVLDSLTPAASPAPAPVEPPDRAKGRSSVVDGKLVRVSVSQYNTFRSCAVMWAFDKVEKIPRGPPSKGQAIGSEGHGQIEFLLKTGSDVRGEIARAGKEMLEPYLIHSPHNKGSGLVECSLDAPKLITPGGIEFVGFVDYAMRIEDLAVVVDHKFKKSIEKYGVSREDLKNDPQGIVYGAWAVQHFNTNSGVFELHQYQTEGRLFGRPVAVSFSREEVGDKYAALANEIDTKLAPLAGLTKAADATPNTASCGKYGGCPYQKICPYSPANRWLNQFTPTNPIAAVTAKSETSIMGLLDILNTPNKAPPPPPPATVAPVKFTAGSCVPEKEYTLPDGAVGIFKGLAGSNAFFQLKKDNAPFMISTDAEVAEVPPPVALVITQFAPNPSLVTVKTEGPGQGPIKVVSILPPDAPVSQPNAAAISAAAVTIKGSDAASGHLAGPTPTPAPAPAPAPTPAPAVEKPKRGRPTKEEQAAKAAAVPTEAPTAGAFILLVDCATNRPATDLNAEVARMAKAIAEASEVLDIRCAPKKTKEGTDHLLAFGGWKGTLAGVALKSVPAGLCSINSSELNDPVIEAYSGVATLVVRGGVR